MRDDAVAGVGTAALHHLALAGGDAAVAPHADLERDVGLRARAMGEKILLARELHHHLAGGGARKQRGDDLEVEDLDARAEPAADERLDHANARGVHLQAAREHQVQVVADLRHALHGEPPGERIVLGQAGMRLDLRVVDLGAADALLAHEIGRGKPLLQRRRTRGAPRARGCRACCRAADARRARARPRDV